MKSSSNNMCNHRLSTIYTGLFGPILFLVSSVKTVTMLLRSRAAFTLGVRMCSTSVTKGPLLDAIRPSSGKANAAFLSLKNNPPIKLSCSH